MAEIESPYCPECDDAFDFPEPPPVHRRAFLRTAGAIAAAAGLSGVAAAREEPKQEKKVRPAEELIRELFSTLDEAQKKRVVLPFDHAAGKGKRATRLGMYNAPIQGVRIGDVYSKAQQDLLDRIVKAMSSGDEGFRQISRNGRWDASAAFDRCGATLFGDPSPGGKFAFVFAGHHLTIRCDGDSEEGAAFGGPIYYGHSPQGYSRGNIFNYQTRRVLKVHAALDEKQRQKATVAKGSPGELEPSVRFRKREERPGIRYAELSKDQQALVEQVMRDVLVPFRKADVDEVMTIIRQNGGMEQIQLAFYTEHGLNEKEPWEFWRLEGPGFVWNYRVLPHVHTYVNISSQLTGV